MPWVEIDAWGFPRNISALGCWQSEEAVYTVKGTENQDVLKSTMSRLAEDVTAVAAHEKEFHLSQHALQKTTSDALWVLLLCFIFYPKLEMENPR